MPYFTLHRDYILRTNKGHSIEFRKGEKAWVPPMCVPDVVAIGAVSEVKEDGDILPADQAPVRFIEGSEREAVIHAAFEKLIARNERGDFTASGLPHVKKVEDIVGFEVTNKERDAAWMAFTAAKAEA